MGKRLELTGQTFGRLKVIGLDHISNDGSSYWLCECGCQNKTRVVVKGYDLAHNRTKSCGCLRKESNDITGKVFGRLTVLGLDHVTDRGRTYWLCECSCQDRTRIVVRRDGLVSGAVLSCGCIQSESSKARFTKHGMSKSRLYKIWTGIRQRCENEKDPRYDDYGGRGISICDEWKNFENFRDWSFENGYSDELTIDRENNDLGYSPENCRWADRFTQQNNRRMNHHFTYANETKTLAEWTRCLGVKHSTLWYRINRGDMQDFERYFSKINEEDE